MIRIVGHSDHEDENLAARRLHDEFVRWRPEIRENNDDVLILVSVQTPGHRGSQDVDLVVLARLKRPLELTWRNPISGKSERVLIWSFCITIEVKGHEVQRADGTMQVRFQDNKVDVLYGNEWHPASLQAAGQGKSFAKRLKRETGVNPWCVSFVWLIRVTDQQIHSSLNEPNGVLPASFDIPGLVRKILDNDNPKFSERTGKLEYSIWVRDLDFEAVGKHLTAAFAASPLNRKTIDNIIRRRIDFKSFDELGNKQQLVIGQAGSGKTIVLLRTALEFFNRGKRVTILTYNRALVADITRLLMIMKVRASSYAPNINIVTLHSYFIAVIRAIFPEERFIDRKWLAERYPTRLKDSVEYLRSGAATKDDVRASLLEQDFGLFDIACVDEGQDWLDAERDLLHLTIGSENVIVASGFDQLIRQDRLCDWTSGDEEATGETRLRKCLRMKTSLASFANLVARTLGLSEDEWEVEPDEDLAGGNVVVLFGDYLRYPDLHTKLVDANGNAGNKNIDMLFCVEPGNFQNHADGTRVSKLATQLASVGSIWDATVDENRDDPPRSVDVLRLVQYESCRGLEGWTVVAEHLDEFYEHKLGSYKPPVDQQQSFLRDDAAAAQGYAAMWTMIPLTRAIDTLVITVRDANSTLGKAVIGAAKRLPDVVTIYEWDERRT